MPDMLCCVVHADNTQRLDGTVDAAQVVYAMCLDVEDITGLRLTERFASLQQNALCAWKSTF